MGALERIASGYTGRGRVMRKKRRPDERSHVRVNQRRFAYRAAADIQRAFDAIERSNASKDGSATDDAKRYLLSFAGGVVTCRPNPAQFLRMVADALERKLRAAPFDDAILKAHEIAAVKGKRRRERSFPKWLPLSSEAYDEFTKLVPNPPMTERAFRRRANILGLIFSDKLPRKHKPATQT